MYCTVKNDFEQLNERIDEWFFKNFLYRKYRVNTRVLLQETMFGSW